MSPITYIPTPPGPAQAFTFDELPAAAKYAASDYMRESLCPFGETTSEFAVEAAQSQHPECTVVGHISWQRGHMQSDGLEARLLVRFSDDYEPAIYDVRGYNDWGGHCYGHAVGPHETSAYDAFWALEANTDLANRAKELAEACAATMWDAIVSDIDWYDDDDNLLSAWEEREGEAPLFDEAGCMLERSEVEQGQL